MEGKDPAAAGIRRFFSLSNESKKRKSALVVVVVVVVVVARCLLDAVVVVVAESQTPTTLPPSWRPSPRSSPSPSCPRPTSQGRLWRERDVVFVNSSFALSGLLGTLAGQWGLGYLIKRMGECFYCYRSAQNTREKWF